eukprot:CAMPEP_0174916176 /NCGR_PEP_ID=MMETSP1355-20121228/1627_1 /TAXON_ID=464990 /ORGANISM="Hemiselmis tepida, Strain CCMP443" /LENGTH=79 /DNA_ID=CAMNT_0016161153 /DNA_START=476 /DNA_END=715 /DNA_ORIENTATION=+
MTSKIPWRTRPKGRVVPPQNEPTLALKGGGLGLPRKFRVTRGADPATPELTPRPRDTHGGIRDDRGAAAAPWSGRLPRV